LRFLTDLFVPFTNKSLRQKSIFEASGGSNIFTKVFFYCAW
jgi:hypothetical protein